MEQTEKNLKSLAQQTAERILAMIAAQGVFASGDKLPNENDFAARLAVSRATLREAIRILAAHDVLEIRRGKGTYVTVRAGHEPPIGLEELSGVRVDVKALYELRLMVEPQTAACAARRATQEEIDRIVQLGREEEELVKRGEDRTEAEQAFHSAIARAAHNAYLERLLPIIYKAIYSGVLLSRARETIVEDTLKDHRMVVDFIAARDAAGAKTAMELHIIHAMRGFGIDGE